MLNEVTVVFSREMVNHLTAACHMALGSPLQLWRLMFLDLLYLLALYVAASSGMRVKNQKCSKRRIIST